MLYRCRDFDPGVRIADRHIVHFTSLNRFPARLPKLHRLHIVVPTGQIFMRAQRLLWATNWAIAMAHISRWRMNIMP